MKQEKSNQKLKYNSVNTMKQSVSKKLIEKDRDDHETKQNTSDINNNNDTEVLGQHLYLMSCRW